jgi:hypothetical protein
LNTIDTFTVDRQALADAIALARDAGSGQDEKSSSEKLARLLFNGMPFLTCKYLNVESVGNEVEWVVQNHGWHRRTLFDACGDYILVQCKDWSTPVRAEDVSGLRDRMHKTKVRLGIIVAPKGICGRRHGGQAVREIRRAFDTHGLFMLVIAAEHLNEVAGGANFYDMLEYLLERVRFDFI